MTRRPGSRARGCSRIFCFGDGLVEFVSINCKCLFLSLYPSQLRSPFSWDGLGVDVFAAGLLLDADARRGTRSGGLSRRHRTCRSTTSEQRRG